MDLALVLIYYSVIGLLGLVSFWGILALKEKWSGPQSWTLFIGVVIVTTVLQCLAILHTLNLSFADLKPYV
jgi:hypothetical protein